MPKLDLTSDEFRSAGHKLIDWVADYLDGVDQYDVLSRVKPGEIEKQFAAKPSIDGRPYEAILAEVDEKIMPGITHWNHPAFFAYFSI
ncbi:MAG TPA: aspartate aminotransferase family protein, partial [Thermoanaerobaculia bacterium]|nr:aspartate aminotransferase family protein [Thermoanaerobaculia bacterium]